MSFQKIVLFWIVGFAALAWAGESHSLKFEGGLGYTTLLLQSATPVANSSDPKSNDTWGSSVFYGNVQADYVRKAAVEYGLKSRINIGYVGSTESAVSTPDPLPQGFNEDASIYFYGLTLRPLVCTPDVLSSQLYAGPGMRMVMYGSPNNSWGILKQFEAVAIVEYGGGIRSVIDKTGFIYDVNVYLELIGKESNTKSSFEANLSMGYMSSQNWGLTAFATMGEANPELTGDRYEAKRFVELTVGVNYHRGLF